MAITAATIRRASNIAAACFLTHEAELNRLDAQSGDGDMGSTLAALARALQKDTTDWPDDIGESFARFARVIARNSGSSLSSIMMSGFMRLARSATGRTVLNAADFRGMLSDALEQMQRTSRAAYGDKTILDGLKAIIDVEIPDDQSPLLNQQTAAARHALDSFQSKPSKIGRARLAENGGVGLQDPGMFALVLVMEALAQDQ